MIFWLLLALGLTRSGELPGGPSRDVQVFTDVEYCVTSGTTLRMDIYVPRSARESSAPAVLHVHGGGWQAGTKKDFVEMRMMYPLMDAGYVVASAQYRFAPKHPFPAPVEDVKCAVRWLRANAERYHINPDRIGALGASAGGHLVTMLGVADEKAGFEGCGGHADKSSRVQAVANFYGPVDLTSEIKTPLLVRVRNDEFPTKELWKQGSPINYVSPDDPPFLIVHGGDDDIVPVSQSTMLESRLREAKVPVELVVVKNGNHILSPVRGTASPGLKVVSRKVVSFFDRTLKQ